MVGELELEVLVGEDGGAHVVEEGVDHREDGVVVRLHVGGWKCRSVR